METPNKINERKPDRVEFEEAKNSLDFGMLRGIYGEILERAGIKEEERKQRLDLLSPERLSKGFLNSHTAFISHTVSVNSALFYRSFAKGLGIKLGHEDDGVGIAKVLVDEHVVHEYAHLVLAHNEQHFLHGAAKPAMGGLVEKWPVIYNQETGVRKLKLNLVSYGDSKRPYSGEESSNSAALVIPYKRLVSHEALNEAITDRVSRRILHTYYERTGQRKNIDRLKILRDAEDEGNYVSNYVPTVKFLEVLLETLSSQVGIDKEKVWESFLVGYSNDPRAFLDTLAGWFREQGLEELYDEYARINPKKRNFKELLLHIKNHAMKRGIPAAILEKLHIDPYLPSRAQAA